MSKKNTKKAIYLKMHYKPTNYNHLYCLVYGAYKRFVRKTTGQLSDYYPYDKFLEQIKYFGSDSTYFNIGYDMLVAELKGIDKEYVNMWMKTL